LTDVFDRLNPAGSDLGDEIGLIEVRAVVVGKGEGVACMELLHGARAEKGNLTAEDLFRSNLREGGSFRRVLIMVSIFVERSKCRG
jgi:hypothetical protein